MRRKSKGVVDRNSQVIMRYNAKYYYQDKDVAGRYYEKRFNTLPGRFNHFLEKSFLINGIRKLEIESALDVACGTGRMTRELLSLRISNICGADISQEMLDLAKIYCGDENKRLVFKVEDATDLSFQDNSYDLIISFRFLDHLPEIEKKKALSEMIRCSKKFIVFSMANKNRWTILTQKIRKLMNRNYYEGYLINELDILAFIETQKVKVVRSRLKFPLLSMEIMYFCEKK
jgi:ubiquinone/menaquinone biosynthesis C-methylase UbiE